MAASKLTRRALALRLFALIVLINFVLLWFFLPAAPEPQLSLPAAHVEIKVRAQLLTSFAPHKKVLLARQGQSPIGSAWLARLDEDAVVLWLPEELYRQHHQGLMSEEWAVIPYLAQMQRPTKITRGEHYEIAY